MKDLNWQNLGEEFSFSIRCLVMYTIFWLTDVTEIPLWFLPLWAAISFLMGLLFEGIRITLGISKSKTK